MHSDLLDKTFSNLSNFNASGLDQIDTSIIKLVKSEILPAVTHKSKIIPLHKKDDLLNPKNYQPVAIVPILSKILERVIFNEIT